MTLAKRAIDSGAQSGIEGAYALEVEQALEVNRSEDAERAADAFRQRAKPPRKGT